MWLWTWTFWERVWRSALKQRRHWTSSPLSSSQNTLSWCACRWTKLPSQSGKKREFFFKKIAAVFQSSPILLNFLLVMFFLQWISDEVWEPAVGEECRVTQEQKVACSRLRIPSSPGELEHVQEGFRLQLVENNPATYQVSKCFIAFRNSCHTSAMTKQVVKKQWKSVRYKSGAFFKKKQHMQCLHSCEYLSHFNSTFCFQSGILSSCLYGFIWKCIYDGHIQDVCFIWCEILSMNSATVIFPSTVTVKRDM